MQVFNIPSKDYKKDTVIFSEGDPVRNKMYYVVSGELVVLKRIQSEEYEELNFLKTGSFFGELGLISTGVRTAAIKVTSPYARVATIDKQEFAKLSRTHPDFLFMLLQKIVERLINATSKLEDIKKQIEELENLGED